MNLDEPIPYVPTVPPEPVASVIHLDEYREVDDLTAMRRLSSLSDESYVSDEQLVAAAKVLGVEAIHEDIASLDLRASQYERWAERARHTAEVLREWLSTQT